MSRASGGWRGPARLHGAGAEGWICVVPSGARVWHVQRGQGLRVLMADGEWYDVVIELDGADQWYLPPHPGVSPIGLWAQV